MPDPLDPPQPLEPTPICAMGGCTERAVTATTVQIFDPETRKYGPKTMTIQVCERHV